jgi:hypothetical protein
VCESNRSVSSSRDGSKLVGDIDERGHRCHVRFEGFGAPVIEEATVDHSRVGKTGFLQLGQISQLVFDCGEELEMPLEVLARHNRLPEFLLHIEAYSSVYGTDQLLEMFLFVGFDSSDAWIRAVSGDALWIKSVVMAEVTISIPFSSRIAVIDGTFE